jgi:predicted lipoprotein with Yx(FWY)xxD motif
VFALAISAVVLAGCGSSSGSGSKTAEAATTAPETSSTTTSSAESGPEKVATAKGEYGTYLTADDGRALYLWVADAGGKSVCYGACAHAWPAVETEGKPAAESGVKASDLGTVTRKDGSEQVTYKGHPLYYFIADKSAGQAKGQGSNSFGAKWWLVAPSGSAITKEG